MTPQPAAERPGRCHARVKSRRAASAAGTVRDRATRPVGAVAERRLPRGVLAGAADHDDADVLGLAHDGHHGPGRVHDAVTFDLLLAVLGAEPGQREARVLEQELLDLLLG